MLPWLFERKRVKIDEMAGTFGLDRDTLIADLTMSTFCGMPPYSPLELIEIYFDDEEIWIEIPRIFTRPLRLSVEEAFTLKAVGEAAMSVMGASTSSSLASALAKLPDLADEDALVVRQPVDPNLAALGDCAASREVVSIDYFTPVSGERTNREIVPMRMWVDGDHWYCDALDFTSGEHRLFRLDRIESMTRTGRHVEAATLPALPDEPGFNWTTDAPDVTLRLARTAHWVAERYPNRGLKKVSDDIIEVTLPVANVDWLGRLLVRAGRGATVVSPVSYADLGAETARKIRSRYV